MESTAAARDGHGEASPSARTFARPAPVELVRTAWTALDGVVRGTLTEESL
jgi:hypothetical protein